MSIKRVIDRLSVIEKYVENKDVLDVGCVDVRPGNIRKYDVTGLHKFIREKARSVTGVDIDRQGVEEMAAKGYSVVCASAETMDLQQKYSCIVAGEVIEHVNNAGLFLSTLASHLEEDGRIILTTPNAFGIQSFFRIIRANSIKVHPDHTCWYDPQTLRQLVERYDLKIVEVFFTNKTRWYNKKYFYKVFSYQLPRFFTMLRPYFSTTIVAVIKKVSPTS